MMRGKREESPISEEKGQFGVVQAKGHTLSHIYYITNQQKSLMYGLCQYSMNRCIFPSGLMRCVCWCTMDFVIVCGARA